MAWREARSAAAQVAYYLSPTNLAGDAFLRARLVDGWAPLALLVTFKKLRGILQPLVPASCGLDDEALIAVLRDELRAADELALSDDGCHVRLATVAGHKRPRPDDGDNDAMEVEEADAPAATSGALTTPPTSGAPLGTVAAAPAPAYNPDEDDTIFIRNLSSRVTSEVLRELFLHAGPVTRVYVAPPRRHDDTAGRQQQQQQQASGSYASGVATISSAAPGAAAAASADTGASGVPAPPRSLLAGDPCIIEITDDDARGHHADAAADSSSAMDTDSSGSSTSSSSNTSTASSSGSDSSSDDNDDDASTDLSMSSASHSTSGSDTSSDSSSITPVRGTRAEHQAGHEAAPLAALSTEEVDATTFAFVQFSDSVSARYAVRLLHGVPLYGLPIKLRLAGASRGGAASSAAPAGCTLFVRRLPLFMDEWDLWDLGRIAGPLVEASLPASTFGEAHRARPLVSSGVRQRAEPSRGYGFLVYASRMHARHAMRVLSGIELCGQAIEVSVSARSSAGASASTDDSSASGDSSGDDSATIFDAGGAADLDGEQVTTLCRYEPVEGSTGSSTPDATAALSADASAAGEPYPPVLQRFSSGGLNELPLSRAAVIGLQTEALRTLARSLGPACIAAASTAAAARASATDDAGGLRSASAADAAPPLTSPSGSMGRVTGSPYVAPPSIFGQPAGSADHGGAMPPPAKRSRFSDAPAAAGTGTAGTIASPTAQASSTSPAVTAPAIGWMPVMPPVMPWFGMLPGWPPMLPVLPAGGGGAGTGGLPWAHPPPAGVPPIGFSWPPPMLPPPGPWMAAAAPPPPE